VYYTKDDATDSIELGERARCYFIDVTEAEKNALDALHGLNNSTYEKVDETYSAALAEAEAKTGELNSANEALEAKNAEFEAAVEAHAAENSANETKIGELNEAISTLTTERDDATNALIAAREAYDALSVEVQALHSFKAEVEKKEKEAVVAKYAKVLDAEVIADYTARVDEYANTTDLDKELAYALVSSNQSVFTSNGEPQPAYVPHDNGVVSGLGAILDKYKK
jgi:chromosome segregation ATPase